MRHSTNHSVHQRLFCTVCLVLTVGVVGLATADEDAGPMTLSPLAKVEKQEFDWGWIAWTMNDRIDPKATMTFGVVYLKPHQTNTFHLHPNADEILHVIEGTLEHRTGKGWARMGPGDTIRIPKGVPHNARTTDEACRVVVVYDTGAREFVPVDEEAKP